MFKNIAKTVRLRKRLPPRREVATVASSSDEKELKEHIEREKKRVSQKFQAWSSANILGHDRYHNIRTGLRIASPAFSNPIIYSKNEKALAALSEKIRLTGKPVYNFDSHLEIERNEPNLSEEMENIFTKPTLRFEGRNMINAKEKFAQIRKEHVAALEKICGFEVEGYPSASLLETVLMDQKYTVNSIEDYTRAIAQMSYSYRGNLKLEIQKSWINWVQKVVDDFLTKSINLAELDQKYDHDCMVVFNLLEDETFFPFSGFFTPIQLRRFFSLAGYIREHKGAPIFASDGQSLMVPTYHLNVPSDFVADKRHGPNLKIIYDEEFSPESSSKSAQPMTSRVRSYTTGEVFVFYEKPEFAKRAVEIFNQQKWSRFLPMMKSEQLHNKAFRIKNSEIRARIPTSETDIDRCDAIWKFFDVKNPPDRAVQRAIYQESLPVLEDHVKKAENGDPYKFLETITNDLANGQNLHAAIVFVAKLLQIIHTCFDLSVSSQAETNIAFLTIHETKDLRELLQKQAVVQVLEGKEQFVRRSDLEKILSRQDLLE